MSWLYQYRETKKKLTINEIDEAFGFYRSRTSMNRKKQGENLSPVTPTQVSIRNFLIFGTLHGSQYSDTHSRESNYVIVHPYYNIQ